MQILQYSGLGLLAVAANVFENRTQGEVKAPGFYNLDGLIGGVSAVVLGVVD